MCFISRLSAIQQCLGSSSKNVPLSMNDRENNSDCMTVALDGQKLLLTDTELALITSESHGLFNRKISFELRDECML